MTAAVAWPELAARAAAFLNPLTEPLRATTLEMIEDGGIMLVAIGFLGLGVLFADIVATFARGTRQFRTGAEQRVEQRSGAVRAVRAAAQPQRDAAAKGARTMPEPDTAENPTETAQGDNVLQAHGTMAERASPTAAASAVLQETARPALSRSARRGEERALYRQLPLSPRPRSRRRRFGVDEAA